MSRVIFSDFYGTEVNCDFSRSGLIRLDLKSESWPVWKHSGTGESIPYCISLTKPQAQMLVCALEQLLNDEGQS